MINQYSTPQNTFNKIQVSCVVCNRPFWKYTKKKRRYKYTDVCRSVNCVTCSKKCSKMWMKKPYTTRPQIYLNTLTTTTY